MKGDLLNSKETPKGYLGARTTKGSAEHGQPHQETGPPLHKKTVGSQYYEEGLGASQGRRVHSESVSEAS